MLAAGQLWKIRAPTGTHNGAGGVVAKNRERPEYSMSSLSKVSSGKTSLQQSHEPCEKIWSEEDLPVVKDGDKVRDYLKWAYASPWDLMGCTHEC